MTRELRMADLLVVATREISSEPQPGIVEVSVFDIHGKAWCFVDKYPIFGLEHGAFPRAALMRCQMIQVEPIQKHILISTSSLYPSYETAEFWVHQSQLVAITEPIDFSKLEVSHEIH